MGKFHWIIFVCACGRIPVSPPDETPDAGSAAPDVTPTGDGTTGVGAWAAPTRIDSLSTSGYRDTAGTIRPDLCEMFFMTNRRGKEEIWVSSRFSATEPWADPTPVDEINAIGSNSSPDISADGGTLLFSRYVNGNWDLYVTTRSSPTSAWAMPQPIAELNTADVETQPELSSDGKTIWFTRATATEPYEIYTATRTLTGPWQNIRAVARLNSTAADEQPTVTGDELIIYFDSERSGGVMTMYQATRDPGMPWNDPVPVLELANAYRADVSPDDRYMVLSMTGPDQMSDLYETHRMP